MALGIGDILRITDVQSYLSQVVLNVYFYRCTAVDSLATEEDVAEGFENVVTQVVKTLQSTAMLHIRTIVENLSDGITIYERPESIAGTVVSGEALASFYAAGFRLVRTSAITRHGSKRIGGLSEDSVAGNSLTAGALTLANNVAAAMAADIARTGTVDHDFEAEPVIVGRFPIGHADAGELDIATINVVSACQFIRLTTQTTRRAGRGV